MKFTKTSDGLKIWFKKIITSTRNQIWIHYKGRTFILEEKQQVKQKLEKQQVYSKEVISPLPGRVIVLNVKKKQQVRKGEVLLIIEAMKMEHSLQAPINAKIESVWIEQGSFVEKGQKLISFE